MLAAVIRHLDVAELILFYLANFFRYNYLPLFSD